MQNIERNALKSAEKSSFYSSAKNKMLVAAGVVIVLFAALWIWKDAEIKNLKQEHDKRETSLQQQATDLLRQTDYRYLKLLAKPYVGRYEQK
jgi:ABC-type nickel/cobalt efflux system permease component RcnA